MKNVQLLLTVGFAISTAQAGSWKITYESKTNRNQFYQHHHKKEFEKSHDRFSEISLGDYDLVFSNKARSYRNQKGMQFFLRINRSNEVFGLVREYHPNGEISVAHIEHGYLNPYSKVLHFKAPGLGINFEGEIHRDQLSGINASRGKYLNLSLLKGNTTAYLYQNKSHYSKKAPKHEHFATQNAPKPKPSHQPNKKRDYQRIEDVYSLNSF